MRVSIDEKTSTVKSIKAFAKDSGRYTFSITKFTPNKTLPATTFSLDPKKFPGVKVVDLRM